MNAEKPHNILNDIILQAYITIKQEIYRYNSNLPIIGKFEYVDKIYDSRYCIKTCDFIRIVVFDFISYMYFKYQPTMNLYQTTKNQTEESDVDKIVSAMSPLKNRYNKLKGEFDQSKNIFNARDRFETYNANANMRTLPASHKILETEKMSAYDKVLLKHELMFMDYRDCNDFDKVFLFMKKIENGTLNDKKHYTNSDIFYALNDFNNLYSAIRNSDVPIIDKCILLYDIESRCKLELYYKWLKALHTTGIQYNDEILQKLTLLYAFYVEQECLDAFFHYYRFRVDDEQRANFANSVFLFCDDACAYYAKHIDELDVYIDLIIALNVIRQCALEMLEQIFEEKMKDFDYHNNDELNTFLEDFIGNGQHIVTPKDPENDIKYDDLRFIYSEIFPKKSRGKESKQMSQ